VFADLKKINLECENVLYLNLFHYHLTIQLGEMNLIMMLVLLDNYISDLNCIHKYPRIISSYLGTPKY